MKPQILTSLGRPIKSVDCIADFLEDVSKEYNINLESEYVNLLLENYLLNPSNKQHIVINNDGDKYFCYFLSNKDVLAMTKFSKKNNGSNFTKPKKKRK